MKSSSLFYLLATLVPSAFFSCSSSASLEKKIKGSDVFRQNHTGVLIYDIANKKEVAAYNQNRYFTPASNTKLFTYYVSAATFGDSLPGIAYEIRNDSLFFEGTGDPSLLHPDLPTSAVLAFLKSRPEKIFFYPGNYKDKRYGTGWAWSDFNDYYQVEKSSLPLYANVARFTGDSVSGPSVKPELWRDSVLAGAGVTGIERDEYRNMFRYSKRPLPHALQQDIPVVTSETVTLALLNNILQKPVSVWKHPLSDQKKIIKSIPSDSLYTRLMKVSDNMLAEQLLLMYSYVNKTPMNTREAINHAITHHLEGLPDAPVWKDGSGLSRYNQFTPRTMVALLTRLFTQVPRDRLFETLRYQNPSVVLKEAYTKDGPFIFAKTGSLSNNYSLSGYLVTSKGKTFAFSVMNSNFVKPSAEIRKEVERLLLDIYKKY